MERWFQNTRGLVIVVLAVLTCAVLLATEPGDGFPSGASSTPSGDSTTEPVVTTLAPVPTTVAGTVQHPVLQEGSTGSDVTVLQQRLNALGYSVGTPDGQFGAGTKAQVVAFQTAKGITPADGVVSQKTWDALLANPTTSTTPTTTTKP